MMRWSNHALRRLVAVLALSVGSHRADAAPRDVSVTVHVATSSAEPLENVPICVAGETDLGFAFTDASGVAVITLATEDGEELICSLRHGLHSNLSAVQRGLALERWTEYLRAYHFVRTVSVIVAPSVNEYSVNLTASPSVDVSIIVIDGSDEAPNLCAASLDGAWADTITPPPPYVIKGVKRGAPGEIALQVLPSPQIHVIRLTAAQTADNLDLGIVPLIDPARTVPITLTLTNTTNVFTPGGFALFDGVTLISHDGSVIVNFAVNSETGRAVNRPDLAPSDPLVPPGTYYICPGAFGGIVSRRLLDSLRNGRHGDVEAAGVPKVIAIEGQPPPQPVTIDGRAVRDAIMSVEP